MTNQPVADSERKALLAAQLRWGADWRPAWRANAPGRIELLGNHVDYNGGPVLAAAIDCHAVALHNGEELPRSILEVLFADVDLTVTIDPEDLVEWRNVAKEQTPADYARGVVATLIARRHGVRSGRVAMSSSVPVGIGVSSSAAICVSLTQAIAATSLTPAQLVLAAQEAEHRAGTPCGTMDQSASVAGGVILFDGATLNYDELSPQLGNLAFLVIDSGVRRSLSSSSYPIRVEECARALTLIEKRLTRQFGCLAAVTERDLLLLRAQDLDESETVLLRRIQHVVEETERVRLGKAALDRQDWSEFGELMTFSGRSSATLYDISHPVVEEIVALLLEDPAVFGARMMGGGEGGSLLALVQDGSDPAVQRRLTQLINKGVTMDEHPRTIFPFGFSAGASLEPWDQ